VREVWPERRPLFVRFSATEQILVNQAAGAVMLARQLLRNPHWPWTAARALGDEAPSPPQYIGARRRQ